LAWVGTYCSWDTPVTGLAWARTNRDTSGIRLAWVRGKRWDIFETGLAKVSTEHSLDAPRIGLA
jgi:hypothetical protein